MRALLPLVFAATLAAAPPLSPAEQALLDQVSANNLKGHVSFLASDLLEGRDTPSRGLDIAAEYIAAQFRRLGLEPAGDEGYFQNAPYVRATQPMDGFELILEVRGKKHAAPADHSAVVATAAGDFKHLPVVKVDLGDEKTVLPERSAVEGHAVVLTGAGFRSRAAMQRRQALLALQPAVIVSTGLGAMSGARLREAGARSAAVPVIQTNDAEFRKLIDELPAGAHLSATWKAPVEEPLKLRNVIARLPGSDPTLKETYVLLTAHYDHVGMNPNAEGDKISNGANDDASGVATVLQLAEAFSRAAVHPRRTLVFMTNFGEEKGLFGSRYYAAHPVFPLAQTVANLNFEHMGRTDDNDGPRAGKLTASGFDFTSLGDALTEAGSLTGIEAWNDPKNSDLFFGRSDNQALADAGVPAITVAVVWIFPDYHRPGDEWQKLDYANMEREVRTVALAVSRVANNAEAPRWADSPKTERYRKASEQLHATH